MSNWHPHESLVAAGRASSRNVSHAAVDIPQGLINLSHERSSDSGQTTLAGTSEPLNNGVTTLNVDVLNVVLGTYKC